MKLKLLPTSIALSSALAFGACTAFAQTAVQTDPNTASGAVTQTPPEQPGQDDVTGNRDAQSAMDAMTEQSDASPGSDAWITTKVKAELLKTEGLSSTAISVSTDDGKVSLSGTLANKLEVKKAKAAAESVDGVKSVSTSDLKVDGDAPGNEEAHSSSAGEAVSDAWITTKVKSELATTKGVSSMDISVDTVDGVVTLTGVVDSAKERETAEAATRKVKGVKNVDVAGLKTKK